MKGSTSIIAITFSFFFLFIFEAVFAISTKHLCRPEQRDALLEFKNEFKIGTCIFLVYDLNDAHPRTKSWTNNSDCCNWEGITCNTELGEVTELNLTSSCLHGQFYSNKSFVSLQKLQFLTTLDLSFNNFTGPIPSSVGTLSRLTILSLLFNQFSGSIPISIGKLYRLTFLDLSYNLFSGPIPSSIGNLSRLTTISLYSNQFSGVIPSSIVNLSRLTTLNFALNKFSGSIPSSIGKLTRLASLHLDSNKFSDSIPSSIGNLTCLTKLDLSSNQLSGLIPSSIGNITQLTSLYLSSNQISNEIPSSFGKLFKLSYLDISNNKIKGQVPGWLWTLPNLEYLNLSNNTFIGFERSSKHGQSSSKTPSILKYLFGSNNNFMDNIPSSICALHSLITLDLSDNNFNGPIPSCIGNLKSNLSYLNLRRNRLSGGLLEDIFESLKSMDVSQNQLGGKVPRSLIHFSSLEVLNMESNKINDTFPFWLSSLKELKVLVLRSNVFHGPIHQASFPKLQIIDISHNNFSGTLASDYFVKWNAMSSLENNEKLQDLVSGFYQDSIVLTNKGVEMQLVRILKIYTAIDFSGNKFEGEIPRSIGLSTELHVLNLSNNAFSGHIPSSMGNLIALESLDVSQNKLSGEIPTELGNLSFLEVMNFSNNQLEGLVPGGTQFRTQPCSSFTDNMGLYGPSLDEACGNIHTPVSKKTLESDEEVEVISWIAVAIGFGPGLIFGLSVGYILVFLQKHEWFMNPRRR